MRHFDSHYTFMEDQHAFTGKNTPNAFGSPCCSHFQQPLRSPRLHSPLIRPLQPRPSVPDGPPWSKTTSPAPTPNSRRSSSLLPMLPPDTALSERSSMPREIRFPQPRNLRRHTPSTRRTPPQPS